MEIKIEQQVIMAYLENQMQMMRLLCQTMLTMTDKFIGLAEKLDK